jgi:hypothetical protein
MWEPAERRLLTAAAAARAAYFALVLALGELLADYDSSAGLLSSACDADWPRQVSAAPRRLPLVVWDAVFFHRIAHCGYEFEQFHAFFPVLPGTATPRRSCHAAPTHDGRLWRAMAAPPAPGAACCAAC